MLRVLLLTLLFSLLLNLAIFALAYKKQTDKLTDVSYALTFIVLASVVTLHSNRQLLNWTACLMVFIWAIRLGGFLLYRVNKVGKDSRFDKTRNHFFKFLRFWVYQGLTVWILMIPVTAMSQSEPRITVLSILGLAIWLTGLLIESFADYQKLVFTQNPNNKNKWIDIGLWRYSRHPNYFGEILIWIGIYLLVCQSLSLLAAVIGLVSPVYIIVLLLFVSGIPILEKSADKKWQDDETYIRYKQTTSILIPLPNHK